MRFACNRCGKCCSNAGNLALFEWEAKKLGKHKVNIGPAILMRIGKDKRTRIVLQWAIMGGVKCPFLTNKGCSVYGSRPLVCKAFPLSKSGFDNPDGIISGECPNVIVPFEENEKTTKEELARRLKEVYSESFSAAQKLDAARVWVRDLASFVARRIPDSNLKDEEVGLLELAVREGIYDRKFLEKEIRRLEE